VLKAVLETLEGVDDALANLYEEIDGAYFLKIDGIDDHHGIKNLKSSLSHVKNDKDTLKEQIKQLKAENAKSISEKSQSSKEGDEALMEVRGLKDLAETLKAENQSLKENSRRSLIERELTSALASNGVTDPIFLKAATLMLKKQVNVDDNNTAYTDTDMGRLTVKSFVQSWASKEGKSFVKQATGGSASGSQSTGATKDNPWRKETFNLTKQAEVLQNNPELVQSMKAAAL
jgi:hypothetical protein